MCGSPTSLIEPRDQINLSELYSLFSLNTQRTTADLCGLSGGLKDESQVIAFFAFPIRWADRRPFVVMKVRQDGALKCVLNILNSTPGPLKRQTKEQLITCNWAKWKQRSDFFNE